MAAKVVSLRLPEELLDWATQYAETRGVSRTDLMVQGLVSFREDCEAGVPEIRLRAAEVARGVGSCPKNAGGHVWARPSEDPLRSCVHCGLHGREPAENFDSSGSKPGQGGGHFAAATAGRAAFFGAGMKAPMQSGTGDPAKAYPKELTSEQATRAAQIVADKKRRDAVMVADGTARPGQVAGAPKGARS